MKWEIAWEESAAKEIDRLPLATQETILSALARLSIEGRGDVMRLRGPLIGALRLRNGDPRSFLAEPNCRHTCDHWCQHSR